MKQFFMLAVGQLFFLISGLAQNRITGTVQDANTRTPIEYASVLLYGVADSTLLEGVVTDSLGKFSMALPRRGAYWVEVQFLGYETRRISPDAASGTLDLGVMGLVLSSKVLSEVTVTGAQVSAVQKLDRQVFRSDQYQTAQGGTALDVVRQLPSVQMGVDGGIQVRGSSGFRLMVNGKPVQADPAVYLAQLPANAIQDIEIITAPSAKYDPDGAAGIINIKMKQVANDGFYISANARYGLPSIEDFDNAEKSLRFGGGITLNYRKDKWDISTGLDYLRDDMTGRRVGYVNTYRNGILTEFPSVGERSLDRENYSARLTLAYNISEKQSITGSFLAGKRSNYRTADILYDHQQRLAISPAQYRGAEAYWEQYQKSGKVFSGEGTVVDSFTYYNENLRARLGDFLLGAIDYTLNLSPKTEIKLSALYENAQLGGPTDNLNLAWPNTRDSLQVQFNDNDNPLDGIRLQADISHLLGKHRWESGYQYRYLSHPGDFLYLDRDFDANAWVENPLFTNRIDLKQDIHSVYSQVSGQQGKWQYVGGLRLEYFDRLVGLRNPDTTYQLERLNLFPSVTLQYAFSDALKAKAGFSRRIERPGTAGLTPFPEREHSETLEQGDAQLLPEYIDLWEAGLNQTGKKYAWYGTAYYRRIEDVINRVNNVYNDTILNRIYTNSGRATSLGLEVGGNANLTKWLQFTLGTNVYKFRIKGDLLGDAINTANWIYSVNGNMTIKPAPGWQAQLALSYLSERVTAQGRDSEYYLPSLSLRKQFLKDKLTLAFLWQNIDMGLLKTNEQRITTVRNDFYTTTNYVYEVDMLFLSISYQLNQPSKKMKLVKSEFGEKEF